MTSTEIFNLENEILKIKNRITTMENYLKEHPEAKSVGICYSVQMSEEIPLEEHDQLVGLIMNGQETIEISIQE